MAISTDLPAWRTALIEERRTLRWLAEQTGKSARTVYGYSRGELVPPDAWIVEVMRLLGRGAAA